MKSCFFFMYAFFDKPYLFYNFSLWLIHCFFQKFTFADLPCIFYDKLHFWSYLGIEWYNIILPCACICILHYSFFHFSYKWMYNFIICVYILYYIYRIKLYLLYGIYEDLIYTFHTYYTYRNTYGRKKSYAPFLETQ